MSGQDAQHYPGAENHNHHGINPPQQPPDALTEAIAQLDDDELFRELEAELEAIALLQDEQFWGNVENIIPTQRQPQQQEERGLAEPPSANAIPFQQHQQEEERVSAEPSTAALASTTAQINNNSNFIGNQEVPSPPCAIAAVTEFSSVHTNAVATATMTANGTGTGTGTGAGTGTNADGTSTVDTGTGTNAAATANGTGTGVDGAGTNASTANGTGTIGTGDGGTGTIGTGTGVDGAGNEEDAGADTDTAESDDDDEEYDEEELEVEVIGHTRTNWEKYERYVMKPRANKQARIVAKKFCKEAIGIIREGNFLEDPQGHFAKDMPKLPPTNGCVVYAIAKEEGLPELEKGGSCGNEKRRQQDYEDDGVSKDRFFTCIKYNCVDASTEEKLQSVYDAFTTAMQTEKDLPAAQRTFFKLLREEHGECFGPKKQLFIQLLLEGGFQDEKKLGGPLEAAMCDRQVYDSAFDLTVRAKSSILQVLEPLLRRHRNTNQQTPIYYRAVDSWATGFDNRNTLSSKIESTKHLVGEGNSVDTLPNAVHPNATTAEEGFSEAFPEKEKAETLDVPRLTVRSPP